MLQQANQNRILVRVINVYDDGSVEVYSVSAESQIRDVDMAEEMA